MKTVSTWVAGAALMAFSTGALAADCSVSSSVTTGPAGTVVSGTPGKTVTIYDSDGKPIGVITKAEDCAGAAAGATGGSGGSSSVTSGAGAGTSTTTTTEGGLSSSVTVGPGGVSGGTTAK